MTEKPEPPKRTIDWNAVSALASAILIRANFSEYRDTAERRAEILALVRSLHATVGFRPVTITAKDE